MSTRKTGQDLSELLDRAVGMAARRLARNLRGCYYEYGDGDIEEIPTPDQDAQSRNPSLAKRHWQ